MRSDELAIVEQEHLDAHVLRGAMEGNLDDVRGLARDLDDERTKERIDRALVSSIAKLTTAKDGKPRTTTRSEDEALTSLVALSLELQSTGTIQIIGDLAARIADGNGHKRPSGKAAETILRAIADGKPSLLGGRRWLSVMRSRPDMAVLAFKAMVRGRAHLFDGLVEAMSLLGDREIAEQLPAICKQFSAKVLARAIKGMKEKDRARVLRMLDRAAPGGYVEAVGAILAGKKPDDEEEEP